MSNEQLAMSNKHDGSKSTFVDCKLFIAHCLLGLPWETAQQIAMAENVPLLEPLITTPPRVKVLLGQYRVIGYRQRETGWQLIIAAEQTSSQQFTQKSS